MGYKYENLSKEEELPITSLLIDLNNEEKTSPDFIVISL